MNKKTKILIVDFNGTSPTYTHYFSIALKKKAYEVSILGYKNTSDLEIHTEKLNYIGFRTKSKLINYFSNWIYLILKAKSYNIIHIQWLPFLKFSNIDLLGVSILKKRNKNIFYTAHNLYPHDETREKIKARFNKLYSLLNNIVVHTNSTTKNLKKVGYNKNIIKINHGLFYQGFNINNNLISNKMVMLGRICEYKGCEQAIKALKNLNESGCDLLLHIEGSGSSDYIIKLEKLVKKLNVEDKVTIKYGYINTQRLIDLYKEAFVAIMPYKKIEQSGVVFTAFGLNIPVVANNIGGLKDIVQDRINGRLVEKNNLKQLTESIGWVYKNQIDLKSNLNKREYINLWDESANILSAQYDKQN